MILSGMGPFDIAKTGGGRIFEGTYALYSGLVVVLVTGLILAPVFHRVLHTFHVEDDDDEKRGKSGPVVLPIATLDPILTPADPQAGGGS